VTSHGDGLSLLALLCACFSGAPQELQKRAPWGFSWPHCAQITTLLRLNRAVSPLRLIREPLPPPCAKKRGDSRDKDASSTARRADEVRRCQAPDSATSRYRFSPWSRTATAHRAQSRVVSRARLRRERPDASPPYAPSSPGRTISNARDRGHDAGRLATGRALLRRSFHGTYDALEISVHRAGKYALRGC
jgi:hypothetical protein